VSDTVYVCPWFKIGELQAFAPLGTDMDFTVCWT
jgi:hypothetical protein